MNFKVSNTNTNNIPVVPITGMRHTWVLFAFILTDQEPHVVIPHLLWVLLL